MSDNNLTPRIEQLAPELEKIISASLISNLVKDLS